MRPRRDIFTNLALGCQELAWDGKFVTINVVVNIDFTQIILHMNYFELVLGAAALLVNTYVVFVAYRRQPRGWTSRLLLGFWFMVAVYIVVNHLSLNPPSRDLANQLFWIRLVMAVSNIIFPLLVVLTAVMPGRSMTLRPWQLVGLAAVAVVGVALSLSDAVFPTLTYTKGVPTPQAGLGMAYCNINYVGCYVLSIIICLRRYRHAALPEKSLFVYYVIGLSASFLLMMVAAVADSTRTVFMAPLVWSVFFVFVAFLFPDAQERAERR